MTAQLHLSLTSGSWIEVKDGNPAVAALYDRHYSRNRNAVGDPRFAGPGEKLVLVTPCERAAIVLRKFRSLDTTASPDDINVAIFRNEGAGQSSVLIREAIEHARRRWPAAVRFYTYVNDRRILSPNPGYCFKCAGWRTCGRTKTRKLTILEWRVDWAEPLPLAA